MVYVIQEMPGKNILPAAKFGQIVPLLPPSGQIAYSAGFATNQLNAKLSNFNDSDYLLLIGDPVAIGISVAIACKWNKGKAKLLKWDKREMEYYAVEINIYHKNDSLEQ